MLQKKSALGKMFRASSKASTTIEQGPVAKACGVKGKALGKAVESGPGKWKLYDTAPGSVAARDFYLTGFKDGCPRRITGAVAMFAILTSPAVWITTDLRSSDKVAVTPVSVWTALMASRMASGLSALAST